MTQSTLLRLAGQSILKNKMRTLLTMLGIMIGVAAVIVMVAVGHGAQVSIQNQINGLGTNVIMVTPGAVAQGGVSQGAQTFNRITAQDAEKIKQEATTVTAVSPDIFTHSQVIAQQGNWRTTVNGVSADYLTIRNWDVASGSAFDDNDVHAARSVALLGNTVAKNLFPDGNAVGAQVRIDNAPFTVLGVLAPKGQTSSGNDQDDVVLIPYTTAQSRLNGDVHVGAILASASAPSDIPAAQSEIEGIMREAHRLTGNMPDDFSIRNQTELAQAAQGSTMVMTYLLAAIASVSLIVGGIGIMNIMLVSVTERTREIGIRMAIGARGSDVLTQFLVESVVMSVLGGIIGVVMGYAGAALLGHLTGWSTATPAVAVLVAVAFAAAVGVFFGYYPARKAAALDPIQALRYE